jgi:hypothetical protein
MRKALAFAVALGLSHGAFAAGISASSNLTITVTGVPIIGFSPNNPTLSCTLAAGTVVSSISVTGGDGGPITLALSGDTTNFALSGTVPPANVIVGPNGTACPVAPATSITDIVTVTATQP